LLYNIKRGKTLFGREREREIERERERERERLEREDLPDQPPFPLVPIDIR